MRQKISNEGKRIEKIICLSFLLLEKKNECHQNNNLEPIFLKKNNNKLKKNNLLIECQTGKGKACTKDEANPKNLNNS